MEPLRRRLFLLAAAGIVPLAAAAGIALLALAAEQKAQAERSGIEITRALATAIDAELHRSVAALESAHQDPPVGRPRSPDVPPRFDSASVHAANVR